MPSLKPGKLSTPQILSERPPMAEVVVGRDTLWVTVAVPRLAPDEAEIVVTHQSIRLKSKKDPTAVNFVIPLPMAVEPGRFILRHLNGVFDFTLSRSAS